MGVPAGLILLFFLRCISPLCPPGEGAVSFPTCHPDQRDDTGTLPDAPSIKRKNVSRALLESVATTGLMAAHYWARYGLWAEDWQYGFNWNDQRTRWFTLKAQKLDSNSFMTNTVHVLHGAVFYNLARSNGLTAGESFLFSLGSSLIWEYLVEYKEIVAINDNVFTAFAGPAAGEPLHHLADSLQRQPGKLGRVLGVVVNPILALNRWLDRRQGRSLHKPRFPFRFRSRLVLTQVNGKGDIEDRPFQRFHIGLRTRLTSLPRRDRPGVSCGGVSGTLMSRIRAAIDLGVDAIDEVRLETTAAYWGFYLERLTAKERSAARGLRFFISGGSSFEFYRKRSLAPYDTLSSGSSTNERFDITPPTEFSDKMAILNVFGPILEGELFAPQFNLRIGLEGFLHFSQVNAFALPVYSMAYSQGILKTTLGKYGYYYGTGITLAAGLRASFKQLTFDGELRYHDVGSIDGLDRFQEWVTDDVHLHDRRRRIGLSLGYRIQGSPVILTLGYEEIRRWGRMDPIRRSGVESRMQTGIQILLGSESQDQRCLPVSRKVDRE